MRKLLLKRKYRKTDYTIGALYIDGIYFCDTLEDCDRGLTGDMSEAEIIRRKVYGQTAIPSGTYLLNLNIVSSKFRYHSWAKSYGGKVPRIMSVKGFEGVLIHPGNKSTDTLGCVIVGQNKVKGALVNSQDTFHKLMQRISGDNNITITIE